MFFSLEKGLLDSVMAFFFADPGLCMGMSSLSFRFFLFLSQEKFFFGASSAYGGSFSLFDYYGVFGFSGY